MSDDTPPIPGIPPDVDVDIASVLNSRALNLPALIKAGKLDPKTDFVGGDFRGWPLAGQNVRGINFTGADLRGSGIEEAIQDETTILTDAILDTESDTHQTQLPEIREPRASGPAHWHAGVHTSFGNKLQIILARFAAGSTFIKSGVLTDLKEAGITDFVVFSLYSRWDLLIRAWGSEKDLAVLKARLQANSDVNQFHPPSIIDVEEVLHFPERGKYPTLAEVKLLLSQFSTEQLQLVQTMGSGPEFERLKGAGLLLENDTRFTERRIQFYISVNSTQPAQKRMRNALINYIKGSREIKSKTLFLTASGPTLAILKGQVMPGRYYDIYLFLKRITEQIQNDSGVYFETETMLVADQRHEHSSTINFNRAVRDRSIAFNSSAGALLVEGEGGQVEYKSTLRMNLKTGQKDEKIELAALKTIAAFVNTKGGTLMIGVSDDGKSLGLDADQFGSEDRMNRHLMSLVRDRIGPQYMAHIHERFSDLDGKRVFIITCERGNTPAYVKESGVERFYMRTGAATTELSGSQLQDYMKHRFKD